MTLASIMKAPTRSVWALVGLAATSVTAAVAGATWASREVLACWWAPLAGAHFVPGAVCAHPVWGISPKSI